MARARGPELSEGLQTLRCSREPRLGRQLPELDDRQGPRRVFSESWDRDIPRDLV